MSRYSMSVICDNCLIHLLNTIGFTMGQAADRDTQKLFFIENFQLKGAGGANELFTRRKIAFMVNKRGQTSESL